MNEDDTINQASSDIISTSTPETVAHKNSTVASSSNKDDEDTSNCGNNNHRDNKHDDEDGQMELKESWRSSSTNDELGNKINDNGTTTKHRKMGSTNTTSTDEKKGKPSSFIGRNIRSRMSVKRSHHVGLKHGAMKSHRVTQHGSDSSFGFTNHRQSFLAMADSSIRSSRYTPSFHGNFPTNPSNSGHGSSFHGMFPNSWNIPIIRGKLAKLEQLKTVEYKEKRAREDAIRNPLTLLLLESVAALKVVLFYLISLETMICCALTAYLTFYWYQVGQRKENWNGGGMDFIILAFALTTPIAAAIGMAFTRREQALIMMANVRSFAHHLYLAHAVWDWPDPETKANAGGRAKSKIDMRAHSDAVLAQLVGIGDELSRFLTLPTTSRDRHRMTNQGRNEAAQTIEVAYQLIESMVARRMARLAIYTERLKLAGLTSSETSRVHQYERFLENGVESLRMIKMYRTPQALRSFARIFNFLLPPLYAPSFSQVAIDLDSLGIGIALGIVTSLALTALFESLQVLEDPFTGYLVLDGIDVQEEFEVLLFSSLVNTRDEIFPNAPPYPRTRRAALTKTNHVGLTSLSRIKNTSCGEISAHDQSINTTPLPKLEITINRSQSSVHSVDGSNVDDDDSQVNFMNEESGYQSNMEDDSGNDLNEDNESVAEFGKSLKDGSSHVLLS